MKRNRLLIHTAIGLNLKSVKPSERRQTQKIPCIRPSGKGKTIEAGNRSVVARARALEGGIDCTKGIKKIRGLTGTF